MAHDAMAHDAIRNGVKSPIRNTQYAIRNMQFTSKPQYAIRHTQHAIHIQTPICNTQYAIRAIRTKAGSKWVRPYAHTPIRNTQCCSSGTVVRNTQYAIRKPCQTVLRNTQKAASIRNWSIRCVSCISLPAGTSLFSKG
jgi:hypothetical protein